MHSVSWHSTLRMALEAFFACFSSGVFTVSEMRLLCQASCQTMSVQGVGGSSCRPVFHLSWCLCTVQIFQKARRERLAKVVLCFSTAKHYWMVKAGAARQEKHQGSKKRTDKPSKHTDKQTLSLEPIAEIVEFFFVASFHYISAVSASQYRRKT